MKLQVALSGRSTDMPYIIFDHIGEVEHFGYVKVTECWLTKEKILLGNYNLK